MQRRTSQDIRYYGWMLVLRASHKMVKAREKELVPYEISPRQAQVADELYHLGNKATLAELAAHTERGVSALSNQLTRMEKNGLVKKTRHNLKSVLKKFELTEKGIIARENSLKKTSINKIMSVLSDEELQQLILMLNKLINEAENIT